MTARVVVKTAEQLRSELADLERDRELWLRLLDRYGSLEWGLDEQIASVRFLLGDDQ